MAKKRPLLAKDILAAQSMTKSGREAAKYLGVSRETYEKYAKLYGIHEFNKNQPGRGLKRNFLHGRYGIEEILNGKYPFYSLKRLAERLIKAGYIIDKCDLCGFAEKRVVDGKSPLQLIQIDDNKMNYNLDNLQLLCLNCIFLTRGRRFIKIDEPNTQEIKSNQSEIKDDLILSNEEIENIRNEIIDDVNKF